MSVNFCPRCCRARRHCSCCERERWGPATSPRPTQLPGSCCSPSWKRGLRTRRPRRASLSMVGFLMTAPGHASSFQGILEGLAPAVAACMHADSAASANGQGHQLCFPHPCSCPAPAPAQLLPWPAQVRPPWAAAPSADQLGLNGLQEERRRSQQSQSAKGSQANLARVVPPDLPRMWCCRRG